ncbi:beta-1,6-N-acetylglucosaminyltransferase [Weissella cibaria]|uniref:beta-1,6-N-acetylglucosaminyltransferase n=1 Tax=Weissella cibaria TaxID=137591 RepID=UPI003D36ACDA
MKHAILILMHKIENNIQSIINILDDDNISFFVHADLKDAPRFVSQKSKITYVSTGKTAWGTSSLVDAEIQLMRVAKSSNNFDYYHLISGDDFLMMNKKFFLQFFEDNVGRNFIGVSPTDDEKLNNRVKFWYPFANIKMNRRVRMRLIKIFEIVQSLFRVNRIKNVTFKFYKGPQWFSITDQAVEKVLASDLSIYKNTVLTDEVFVQTVLLNDYELSDSIMKQKSDGAEAARYIDWLRGSPYVFTRQNEAELKKLRNTHYVFGRKIENKFGNELMRELI